MSFGNRMKAAAVGTAMAVMVAGGFAKAEPRQEPIMECRPEVTVRLARRVQDNVIAKDAAIRDAVGAREDEAVRVRVQVDVSNGTPSVITAVASANNETRDVRGIIGSEMGGIPLERGETCRGRITVNLPPQ